jgi:alpha-glucoside transport system permease protein
VTSTTVEGARAEPVVAEGVAPKLMRFVARTPVHIVLGLLALFWLVPTLGLFITSLLAPTDQSAAGWWTFVTKPSHWTFENYSNIFNDSGITHALWVTAIVTLGATILPIIVASMAGYALAWIDFPGRDWIFLTVVALLVVPIQSALIPIFKLYNTFNLFDTLPGLILFHTAFALPFATFLLRNFFSGIPKDLMEAARIDGASEIRIFLRVILPLGKPALASLAIFQFLWTWNDLLVALTLARDTQPITVAIFSQLRAFSSNIELIAPATFISLIIPLAVFFAFQRYFVEGLLAGSVK